MKIMLSSCWSRNGRVVNLGLSGLFLLGLCAAGLISGLWASCPPSASAQTSAEGMALPAQAASAPGFTQVAPFLAQRCIMCHSGASPAANLRLDSYEGLMAGGRSGPVVVPNVPEKSEILKRVRGITQPRMPLNGPPWLAEAEVTVIENWIKAGAPGNQPEKKEVEVKEVPVEEPVEEAAVTVVQPEEPKPITYAAVEPIFRERCVKCHSEKGLMGRPPEGIRLDSYKAILFEPKRAIVVPGSPGASLLVRSIQSQARHRMPHDGPPFLDEKQIELITHWVAMGAPDAKGKRAPVPTGAEVLLEGHLSAKWALDGLPLIVESRTRIDKKPSIGDLIEVRGRVQQDGSILATRIKRR